MIPRRTMKLSGGLLAVSAAGGGLLVYPAWTKETRLHSEIREARRQVGARVDRPAETERATAALASLEAFAAEHTRALPSQSDVASLVRGLTIYLDDLGVASREVATGAPTRSGEITVMPMTLSMRCDFLAACSVVAHVESLPRLVRVRRFKLAHERSETEPGALDAPLKAELLLEVLSADSAPTSEKVASPERGGEP